jgi:transmembrane sensor
MVRFLAELNRYRDGWLRCAPEVEKMLVSGVFQVADTNSALRALEQTLPVKVKSFTPYFSSISPAQSHT